MKLWKECPLFISLVVSGLVITVVSAANRDDIYGGYKRDTAMTPVLTVFFQGIKEDKYPWSVSKTADVLAQTGEKEAMDESDKGTEIQREMTYESEWETAGQSEMRKGSEQASKGQEETLGANGQFASEQEGTANVFEQPAKEQEENAGLPGQVEESYFDDALFIGDSRTQGLKEYGGFSEKVTFYSKTSLTVYDLFEKNKAFIKEEEKTLTLEQALTAHQFQKIYLMIGINELGTGTPKTFLASYADAVNKIRELQPEAIIYIQGIMRVGSEKNASDPIFNNENINVRNAEIATLADNQTVFYLDVNEVVCDENGNLYDSWTFDQIHLKAKYYQVWKDYLMSHGVV